MANQKEKAMTAAGSKVIGYGSVAIVYRLRGGEETFRRFGVEQANDIVALIEGLRPGALVGLALSPRAETCRPGRPRGDEVAPLAEGEYLETLLQAYRTVAGEVAAV